MPRTAAAKGRPRFQRSPMMIDNEDSLEGLRAALRSTPKLRALIKKLGT